MMIIMTKSNMYGDSKKQWNVAVGCYFDCTYCKKSFQAQMKRQKPLIDKNGNKRGCQQCYDFMPHFHESRLNDSLPRTKGDEFIWVCSSGDISCFPNAWMWKILTRIREQPLKTFFFQSKRPKTFERFNFPENVILGTTIESNRYYPRVSKAPRPDIRADDFLNLRHPRKFITIEPIMDFDLWTLVNWMTIIEPERIYIGYDTRNSGLVEPSIKKTKKLIEELEHITTVKRKYMKNG